MDKPDRDPWFIIRDLPCLGCGYNLRATTGPIRKCPECGWRHDLNDPYQWANENETYVRQRASSYMLTAMTFCMTAAPLAGVFMSEKSMASLLFNGFLIVFCGLFFIGSLRRLISKERRGNARVFDIAVRMLLSLAIPILPVGLTLSAHRYQDFIAIPAPFFFLFPGIAIAIACFLLLRRLVPDRSIPLPDHLRYCDAIDVSHPRELASP
jgi:hypothetical protein